MASCFMACIRVHKNDQDFIIDILQKYEQAKSLARQGNVKESENVKKLLSGEIDPDENPTVVESYNGWGDNIKRYDGPVPKLRSHRI